MTRAIPLPPSSAPDAQPEPPGRLADRVYGRVLEIITTGGLEVGDRLPSENELSRLSGASRPIVREALQRLQGDGVLESRRGSGSYLRHRPPEQLIRHLRPVEVALHLRSFEVRIGLESEAARLAAVRRSDAQIESLRGANAQLRDAIERGENAAAYDLGLHRLIAVASGNDLFLTAFEHIQVLIEQMMAANLAMTRDADEVRARRLLDEHEAVIQAIADGDADAAATAMRWHLLQARKRATDVRFNKTGSTRTPA